MNEFLAKAGVIGSVSSIILYVLIWWRFWRKDRASTSKTLAESYEIKTRAEIAIAEEWKKIADNFKDQIAEEREECEKAMQKQKEHFEHKIGKMEQKILLLEETLKNK